MQIQIDYFLKMRIETQARCHPLTLDATARQSAELCQGVYAKTVMMDLLPKNNCAYSNIRQTVCQGYERKRGRIFSASLDIR